MTGARTHRLHHGGCQRARAREQIRPTELTHGPHSTNEPQSAAVCSEEARGEPHDRIALQRTDAGGGAQPTVATGVVGVVIELVGSVADQRAVHSSQKADDDDARV